MKLILIAVVLLVSACTSSESSTRALQGAGYKDVRLTGYDLFGCSKDDMFHDGFEATGPSGQKVTGVVCSNLLKGSTIRTY